MNDRRHSLSNCSASLALALIGICIVTAAVAGSLTTSSLLPAVLFLPLPVILWAAVRFGEKGASGAVLIVAVILTFIGDRLSLDLYLVALINFGFRIFNNVALIRRHYI